MALLALGDPILPFELGDANPVKPIQTHSTTIFQGFLNVPFWVYWTSPYSSHKKDHIPIMESNGWVM